MEHRSLFGTETEYGYFVRKSENHAWFRESSVSEFIRRAIIVAGIKAIPNDDFANPAELYAINDFADALRDLWNSSLRGNRFEASVLFKEAFRIAGMSGFALANGARFYVDCGHPEYSTPECTSALELVRFHRAGDLLVDLGRRAVEMAFPVRLRILKDNSDRKGASFAAHENYLLSPETFLEIVRPYSRRGLQLLSYLLTRQVVVGAGKVGCEDAEDSADVPFQLSQRADFISASWGLDTMHHRAIVNTRDRPYADPRRFRRLHVILGDANLCDVALWLKIGITAMVLELLECDYFEKIGSLLCVPFVNGIEALKVFSRDPTLRATSMLWNGKQVTALDIQREVAVALRKYFSEVRKPTLEEQELLAEYERVLDALSDPQNRLGTLVGTLDWVTKLTVLEGYVGSDVSTRDNRFVTLDALYHDMNPEQKYSARWLETHGHIRRLVTNEEVAKALHYPPRETRAYLRGNLIRRFPSEIERAWWRGFSLKRDDRNEKISIDLPDPFRGAARDIGPMIEAAESAAALCELLEESGWSSSRGGR